MDNDTFETPDSPLSNPPNVIADLPVSKSTLSPDALVYLPRATSTPVSVTSGEDLNVEFLRETPPFSPPPLIFILFYNLYFIVSNGFGQTESFISFTKVFDGFLERIVFLATMLDGTS